MQEPDPSRSGGVPSEPAPGGVLARPLLVFQRRVLGPGTFGRFWFISATRRASSPGPALYAAPAHKCCSLALHRVPPLPGLRLRRPVRGSRGTRRALGGPPGRLWVLLGCLTNLPRTRSRRSDERLRVGAHRCSPGVQRRRLTSEALWSIGSRQAPTWIACGAFGSFLACRRTPRGWRRTCGPPAAPQRC